MAGAGRRTFTPGEVLTASNVMNYLQDQVVQTYAGTAARGSAIGTAVSEGMVSYLADNNFVQVHDGTAWRSVGGIQVASGTATRDALLPTPVQGDKVFRNDLGFEQTYYGLYNSSTNPGGRAAAGWYNDQRNIGLVPVVPSTVRISGGTATANTLGTVSFTSATSIGLDGIFTSAYKSYKIMMTYGCNASVQLQMRYTVSGTPNNSSSYTYGGWWARANAGGNSYYSSASVSQFGLGFVGADSDTIHSASVDIFNPQLANKTTHTALIQGADGTSQISVYTTGLFNSATQLDGVYLYLSGAANISGTITVYGYNS